MYHPKIVNQFKVKFGRPRLFEYSLNSTDVYFFSDLIDKLWKKFISQVLI
jgi:hypothetical protein